MKSSRREFINAATGAGLSALFLTMGDNETPRNSAQASPVAPDPNDPNDPNAITDPDHEIGKPYVGWREGELDLNFISTGVGENMFYIFPTEPRCYSTPATGRSIGTAITRRPFRTIRDVPASGLRAIFRAPSLGLKRSITLWRRISIRTTRARRTPDFA